jgi:hypothetical protein
LIDGGRIKEYADDGDEITRVYRQQLAACTYEVVPGPGRLQRWDVSASRRHDDLLISAALAVRFDVADWRWGWREEAGEDDLTLLNPVVWLWGRPSSIHDRVVRRWVWMSLPGCGPRRGEGHCLVDGRILCERLALLVGQVKARLAQFDPQSG